MEKIHGFSLNCLFCDSNLVRLKVHVEMFPLKADAILECADCGNQAPFGLILERQVNSLPGTGLEG